MAKVNVSISDELLAEVDEIAVELKRSRSGLVQEATAHYVAELRAERERREREDGIRQAMAGARKLSERIGRFDPVPIIRADRERDTPR
jgi:metal-responsive CopG/Arc/MetJ family transcriptional regulator